MSDTFYYVPQDKQARAVTVHRRQPDGSLIEGADASRAITGFVRIGGGGLSSTASDYIRFTRMLLKGWASSTARASCRRARWTRWRKSHRRHRASGPQDGAARPQR